MYALVKGYTLNKGKIIEESILDYVKGKYSGNIPHPSLITLLFIKGGVKFSEAEEERCLKASPLSLIGALKALVESDEGERRRKMKRIIVQPREPAPTVVAEEEMSSEEMRALKPTQNNQCSLPLQKKQHQLQLELKRRETEEW